jgi:hypothetical protein
MANILLDMIDNKLSIPMKWQGYLDMYNGIDVLQMRDYIRITCKTFINKTCNKYLDILSLGTNSYFKYEFVPATPVTAVGETRQPT